MEGKSSSDSEVPGGKTGGHQDVGEPCRGLKLFGFGVALAVYLARHSPRLQAVSLV